MDLLSAKGEIIQSADLLLSILAAICSLALLIFSFFSARSNKTEPPTPPTAPIINTGGGAYIGGSVTTGNGNFTGRDNKIS